MLSLFLASLSSALALIFTIFSATLHLVSFLLASLYLNKPRNTHPLALLFFYLNFQPANIKNRETNRKYSSMGLQLFHLYFHLADLTSPGTTPLRQSVSFHLHSSSIHPFGTSHWYPSFFFFLFISSPVCSFKAWNHSSLSLFLSSILANPGITSLSLFLSSILANLGNTRLCH